MGKNKKNKQKRKNDSNETSNTTTSPQEHRASTISTTIVHEEEREEENLTLPSFTRAIQATTALTSTNDHDDENNHDKSNAREAKTTNHSKDKKKEKENEKVVFNEEGDKNPNKKDNNNKILVAATKAATTTTSNENSDLLVVPATNATTTNTRTTETTTTTTKRTAATTSTATTITEKKTKRQKRMEIAQKSYEIQKWTTIPSGKKGSSITKPEERAKAHLRGSGLLDDAKNRNSSSTTTTTQTSTNDDEENNSSTTKPTYNRNKTTREERETQETYPTKAMKNNNSMKKPTSQHSSSSSSKTASTTTGGIEPEMKLGRLLASPITKIRHRTVIQLRQYLEDRSSTGMRIADGENHHHSIHHCDDHDCHDNSHDDHDMMQNHHHDHSPSNNHHQQQEGGLSEMDLLKLWKALWYTLYMCDQPVVWDELALIFASFIWCVAGSVEDDEYIGQSYLDLTNAQDEEALNEEEDNDIEMIEEEEGRDDHVSNGNEDENDDDDDIIITNHSNKNNVDNDNDDDDIQYHHHNHAEEEGEEQNYYDDEDDEEEDDDSKVDPSMIPHCRGAHLASLLVRTCFRTVVRDWGKMDKYRVDKFYTLLRYMMCEIYKYMALRHWNIGIIRLFNDAIFEEVLCQPPNGVRFHLIDIALSELAYVNTVVAPMTLTEATFLDCVEPFLSLAQTGGGSMSVRGSGSDDVLQKRVVDQILNKFLNEYSILSDHYVLMESSNDATKSIQRRDKQANVTQSGVWANVTTDNREAILPQQLIMSQVHVGTLAEYIFRLASDASNTIKDQYRKSLYEVYKSYQRRLKLIGKDVELTPPTDEQDDDDAEEYNSEEGLGQPEPDHMVNTLKGEESDQQMGDDEGAYSRVELHQVIRPLPVNGSVKAGHVEPENVSQQDREALAIVSKDNTLPSESKKKKTKKKNKKGKKKDDEKSDVVMAEHLVHTWDNDKVEELPKNYTKPVDKRDNDRMPSLSTLPSNKRDRSFIAEEVVTISMSDQIAAKAALAQSSSTDSSSVLVKNGDSKTVKESKKDRKRRLESNSEHVEPEKKVKFLDRNHSRSWVSSMKNLRERELPAPTQSPDKGILLKRLNRPSKPTIMQASGRRRRRAIDYF